MVAVFAELFVHVCVLPVVLLRVTLLEVADEVPMVKAPAPLAMVMVAVRSPPVPLARLRVNAPVCVAVISRMSPCVPAGPPNPVDGHVSERSPATVPFQRMVSLAVVVLLGV